MRFNPEALAFWALSSCIGYLIGGSARSAVAGLAIGLSVSFLVGFLVGRR